MKFSPWTAAAAVTLLLSAAAMAVATEDDICTGSKPFREVAQDEIYTMAELCRMREDSLREDRERAPLLPSLSDQTAQAGPVLALDLKPLETASIQAGSDHVAAAALNDLPIYRANVRLLFDATPFGPFTKFSLGLARTEIQDARRRHD